VVPERQVWDQKEPEQLLSQSHKTAEQLIKWLPGQFTLIPFIIYSLALTPLHCLDSTQTLTHTYYTNTPTHTQCCHSVYYTFTPTHMYILHYLNYLVRLHIYSVLVLLVYSLTVFIVLLFPFLFSKYLPSFLTLHCWEWARK
jgi:hypothetical protein